VSAEVTTATRVIFADNLARGSVLVDECRGLTCFISATRHCGTPHERTVLDLRTRGDDVIGIVVDEDGEQQRLHYGTWATVRIRVSASAVSS
jgi:hypothetical protein